MLVTLYSLVAVAPMLAPASASAEDFQFPASVPLDKRQREGPKFECHSACGNIILQSESSDYCDDSTWNGLLEDCLDCALEHEIWQHYRPQIVPAAESCGLDATPKPAGSDSDDNKPEPQTSAEAQTSSTPEPTREAEVEGEEESKPELEDDSQEPTDVVPPSSTPTPVEGGAAALGLSNVAATVGMAFAVIALIK